MAQTSCSDLILLASLLYLSVDIQYEWDDYRTCRHPIHKWLLGSYIMVLLSRLVYMLGALISAADTRGDFLLDLRHKGMAMQLLTSLTWLVIVPGFTLWSALGTVWIYDVRHYTPECLPSGVHLWFLVIWQLLSYIWILTHLGLGAAAWLLERRLQRREGDLRQLEHQDADMQSRWGRVSQLPDYTSLADLAMTSGLTPAQIAALPGADTAGPVSNGLEEECPICLSTLQPGDSTRQLVQCGHNFHRSCIDLWLLRRADCPLCKGKVGSSSADSSGKVIASV